MRRFIFIIAAFFLASGSFAQNKSNESPIGTINLLPYKNKAHKQSSSNNSNVGTINAIANDKQAENQQAALEQSAAKDTLEKIADEQTQPDNATSHEDTVQAVAEKVSEEKTKAPKFSVDKNIPETSYSNPNAYALIIGNEDYNSYQKDLEAEQNVDFATRDARMFKTYCKRILGVPESNILDKYNLTASEMHRALAQINTIIKHTGGEAAIYFYYAGHGYPDPKSKEPYLIPVDVTGSQLSLALSLKKLYQKLTEYPTEKVMVFLDACFTGGARDASLMASRGIRIKPKDPGLQGNIVAFSASSKDQSALPYKANKHGMFTYYLLKKLKTTEGDVTLGELKQYLTRQVPVRSTIVNEKEQVPKVNISTEVQDEWKSWSIR